VQTTTTPTTGTPDPLSKKELEAIRNRENRRLHEQYHKEVKESLAENRDIHIHIPTDAASNIIGLKVKWQNVVKDIMYRILDFKIRHWDQHPQEQKMKSTDKLRHTSYTTLHYKMATPKNT
jgi:hypothetical protein